MGSVGTGAGAGTLMSINMVGLMASVGTVGFRVVAEKSRCFLGCDHIEGDAIDTLGDARQRRVHGDLTGDNSPSSNA